MLRVEPTGSEMEVRDLTMDASRTVVANIAMSLDGRTTGPGGDFDMGWIVPHATTDAAREGMLRLTKGTTALLGRKNYEGFGSFWPMVAQDEGVDSRDRVFAQWLNGVEKVVISSTLTEASWSNSRLVREAPSTVVRQLRTEPGGDIVILASQSIIRQLLEADEVDQLSINLAPELVGGGSRLFPEGMRPSSWTLTEVTTSDSGSAWLRYDRKRSAAPLG